jgi:putative ABC transport system permease protein
LPIGEVPSVDLRMLAFAAILAAVTGIGFGVLPALRASGAANLEGLREGGRGGIGGRKERLRSALVMAEVTGSVVLLVSAGLLVRALWRLQQVDPGFRAQGVLSLRTALPMPKYNRTDRRVQFYRNILSEVRSLPGVAGAAYTSSLPLIWGGGIWHVSVEGRPPDQVQARDASLRFVTPGFFAVMGIPLLQGRDVSEADTVDRPFAAVVSESFVRKYWPGQNPLGRRFSFAFDTREVVGVVGDVRVRGLERVAEPQVYVSYRQMRDSALTYYAPKDLVIRSSVDPAALLPALRRIIGSADPAQPVSDVRTLADVVDADTAPRQVQVRVLGAFAAMAFLLAGIGLHGLLSFAVASRTQEFGVRIALGAQRGDILAMVLRDGIRLAIAGVVPGVALAYAAGRLLEALLAGVQPADAPTFLITIALCLVMTLGGSLVPAIRAVRVDPTVAMRD